MILPQQVPLVIYQGETFNPQPIAFVDANNNPINLAGYTAQMTVRVTVNSNVISLLATTSNYITINGTAGTISILIPASVISPLAPFEGVWDLFIFSPSGIATRLLGGPICIPESVYQ